MKKYIIIFILILCLSLGLLPVSSMVSAKQTSISSYYPSASGAYTKVLLLNGAGGPDPSSFCTTTSNAGTIFADPNSGYLEICKSDGSVASYPGAAFNRFCPTGSAGCPSCPANYTLVPNNSPSPFPNVTSYSCAFTNSSSKNTYTKSGCFLVFSMSSGPSFGPPVSCTSVDPNAYDMGCPCFQNTATACNIAVRECCFNSEYGQYALNASSICPMCCPSGYYNTDGNLCPPNYYYRGSCPAGTTPSYMYNGSDAC